MLILKIRLHSSNNGIQIVDLIAGFTDKVINKIYNSNIDENEIKILLKIQELYLKNRGGINLVVLIDKQEKVFCIIENINV